MPVESDQDREAFLSASEFAVAVAYTVTATRATYIYSIDGITPITGIFDDNYNDPFGGLTSPGISTTKPRILMRAIDIPAMATAGDSAATDTILINGVVYYVRDFNPDGTGMTTLQLEEKR